MIDRDELAAWLRLLETPDLSVTAARRWLSRFGDPLLVVQASRADLVAVAGEAAADTLIAGSDKLDTVIDATWAWLNAQPEDGRRDVVVLGDPRYPSAWLEMSDPPLLIYTIGRTELLHARAVAVVGSRNPTAQGLENARQFAGALSQQGLTIASGLALGIDGAAHEGGLSGTGSTIAAVGTGLDRVYPSKHHALARRIAADGLMLSEYPLGTPPLAGNFPRRNRLIAGLSLGTLVVEAALKSGSLITARLALEAGREVFAIPGSIHSQQSKGCHALIKQGAKLVETANDILEELQMQPSHDAQKPPPNEAGTGDRLLQALGHEPVTLDTLCERLGEPAHLLNARLLDLELAGQVARLPGQLFQRIVRG